MNTGAKVSADNNSNIKKKLELKEYAQAMVAYLEGKKCKNCNY